jgi:hypothetical protein
VTEIRDICRRTGARRLVVFGTPLSGLAHAVDMPRVLFDVCDSVSLTLRRKLAFERSRGQGVRLSSALALRRWRSCEGALPRTFAQVTTINEADSEEIRQCAGGGVCNVHTVPNGVGDLFLEAHRVPAMPLQSGVAFWGNLGFGPNRAAMRYFFDEVYWPYLQARGIGVCVIGRDAEPWLADLARRDPKVRLLGYVDDLVGTIREYPVMINPMRTGSGMKNKVLEAFATGLAVVSTDLGMESIAEAVPSVHHLASNTPEGFAAAIERLCADAALRQALTSNALRLVRDRYTWSVVGDRWRRLHDELV